MKMSKRIFVALLIVTVFVSAFAFSTVSAAGSSVDYDYLLEYFEEPDIYNYDFSKEDATYSLFMNEDERERITADFVVDENAPGGRYLSVNVHASHGLWEDLIAKNNVYFNWNTEKAIDDFIVEMVVSGQRGTEEEKQLPKIILSVADAVCENSDDSSSLGTTVAALDFRAGCFSYLKKTIDSEGVVSGVPTNTDFVISEGVWYDLYFAYDSASESAFITVTNLSDKKDTYTVSDAYVPYDAIKNIRVGAHGIDGATSRDTVMNFASLRGIGGKFDRDPAQKQTVIEEGILNMYADFTSDDVTLSDKEYLAGVASKLLVYGFTTESEEVQAAYSVLTAGVVSYCNGKLVECTEAYPTIFDYYERRDLVDYTLLYVNYLATAEIPDEIALEVAANVQAVNDLDATLKRAEQASLSLINAVGKNMTADYDNYTEVVNRYNQLYQYGQYADPTYEGASDAYVFYSTISEAKEEIETKAVRFIDAANILDSNADFNTRAEAFLVCKNNYYSNTTYPGLSAAIDIYNTHYDTVNTAILTAENFIKYVGQADYATYVPMKLANLAEAEKYLSCITNDPYKGVMEAKALYDSVKAEVEKKVVAAELYIEAVSKLDTLSGDALTAAIQRALELKVEGNVAGVDGVPEANIKLDTIVSAIDLAPKHKDYFIGLVGSIDSVSSAEELYKLLKEAKRAEKYAYEAVASEPSYEAAVRAASEKLAAATESFNAKVNAVNQTFANANQVAANTCGIGKNVTPVADHVIALIKKLFDEE